MKLHWSRVPRWPRLPFWALGIVGVWGSLVLIAAWMEARTGQVPETCVFHALTGHPCPTCGSTRALQALWRHRYLEALAWNPLVVLAIVLVGGMWLLRLLTGRGIQVELSPTEKRLSMGLGGLLLLMNWGWLLWQQR